MINDVHPHREAPLRFFLKGDHYFSLCKGKRGRITVG
jgi:cupin superfamily acireductone dioxygenase involved in methionine salvage